jgi:polyisoprenoid-binding protein YceI
VGRAPRGERDPGGFRGDRLSRAARSSAGLAALVLTLAALALTLAAAPRAAEVPDPVEYTADVSHSTVGFRVRHLGISWVSGRFTRFAATFVWDPDHPEASWVTATIDAASIDTENGRRDDHLRSEDFLWVERHPTITFASRSVAPDGEGGLSIAGDLTIRGTTRPVVLEATLEGTTTGRGGQPIVAWSAETRIRRQDYDLTWNRVTEVGAFVVGDEVRILLEIEARGPEPAAAEG